MNQSKPFERQMNRLRARLNVMEQFPEEWEKTEIIDVYTYTVAIFFYLAFVAHKEQVRLERMVK